MKKISILLAACVLLCPVISRAQSTIASSSGAAVNVSGQLNAALIVSNANSGAGCPNNNIPLVGVTFSCQLALQGAGGQPPYNYGTITGGLPSGLSMTTGVNGGLISGTATNTTSTTATFPVTDSSSPAQVVTVTITYGPLAVQAVGTPNCPPGSVLASGTLTCTVTGSFGASSNLINTTIDISSLATFSCSGTCGSFAANVFTAGASGGTANLSATFQSFSSGAALPVTITTAGSPVVIQYPTAAGGLPNGQINQAYPDTAVAGQAGVGQCIQVQASGGTPPYTYSISVNPSNLPTGLTFGSSTGQICGSATTAASGASFTIQVADSASHTQTVVISSGITIASLSSLVVNLANNPITPNAQTQASAIGTYSDSTSAPLPNALSGSVVATASGTGSAASTVQVSTGTATTTGWAAIGVAESWISGACSGTTMTITSPNETFTSIATQIGQTGTPPPYLNCVQTFLATNITGAAADKPTCNFSTSSGSTCAIVYVSNIPTSSLLDQSPANTSSTSGTATSCTPNSMTTGQANTIIFGLCFPNGATGFTPPSGYSSAIAATSPNSFDLFYQTVNAVQASIAPAASFSGGASNEVAALFSIKANAPAAGGVVWTSGTPTNATITSSGQITGQPITTTGTSVITGTVGAVNNTATLTVQVANADTSIVIVPNPTATVTVGNTQQYTAIGNVTGNTYQAQWGSSNTTVSTINSSSGLATCLAVGSATISAAVSGFSQVTPTTLNCVSQGSGTVINAATCNQSDVNAAMPTSTATGAFIINVPTTGSPCNWTSPLVYTIPSGVTSLTIQGQTTVTCTGTAGQSTYACTAADNTIINDSVNGQAPMQISPGTAAFRATGLTMRGGTVSSNAGKSDGFIKITGNSTALRVDHMHFNVTTYSVNNTGNGLTFVGRQSGVVDHSIFTAQFQSNGVRYYPENWGDTAYSQPTNLGTSDFIFAENNIFIGGFANDCNQGGREVIRYNSLSADPNDFAADSGAIQTHAIAQGTPRFRGCRAEEKYHNYFTNPTPSASPQYSAGDGNAGTGVSWGNIIGTGYNNDIVLELQARTAGGGNNCGTGGTSSTGCKAPPNGWGYCGNGSSGVDSVWDGNSSASTGYPCIGQPGRGQGDALNNQNFPNVLDTVTGTATWPHEKREPWYVWNETMSSGTVCNTQTLSGVPIVANRDYFCQVSASAQTSATSPFNGTTGTGFGTLAFRPTTCTAGPGGTFDTSPTGSYGVGYFATDANSGQGELYVCTSTNTWTAVYQPYVYPHPLDH